MPLKRVDIFLKINKETQKQKYTLFGLGVLGVIWLKDEFEFSAGSSKSIDESSSLSSTGKRFNKKKEKK